MSRTAAAPVLAAMKMAKDILLADSECNNILVAAVTEIAI
jgi:hypothetical protein